MMPIANQRLNHGIQIPVLNFQFDYTLMKKSVRSVHGHILSVFLSMKQFKFPG
jgi:hypothetical protein